MSKPCKAFVAVPRLPILWCAPNHVRSEVEARKLFVSVIVCVDLDANLKVQNAGIIVYCPIIGCMDTSVKKSLHVCLEVRYATAVQRFHIVGTFYVVISDYYLNPR